MNAELITAVLADGRTIQTGVVARSRSFWGATTGTRYAVLCSDGKVRRAVATAEPDSVWTVPARVQVKGRTVSGHIYVDDHPNGYESPTYLTDAPVWKFTVHSYRRNGDALPQWPTIGANDGRLRTVPKWAVDVADAIVGAE